MLFYKVLPIGDGVQIRKFNWRKKAFEIKTTLIENELYTEKELSSLLAGADLIDRQKHEPGVIFEPVEIPKNRTYWFFGSRFQYHEN